MEKKKLIIKIILVILLSLVVAFFSWKFLYNRILEKNAKNNLTELISYVVNYNTGEYILKNNTLYDKSKNKLVKNINIDGEAVLYKTNYGVNSKYKSGNICVYKTVGNKEVLKFDGSCGDLNIEQSKITYNQNNVQVTINGDFDYYAVSNKDIVPEDWKEYEESDLIINMPYAGEFYVWAKTKYGVVSEPIKISVVCSLKDTDEISDTVVYCAGSKIDLSGYSWHVISDINGELKLLLDSGQLDLMQQCDSQINDKYCYYKSDILFNSYKWSLSKINEYLNKEFIKEIKSYELKEYKVCDETSGKKGCKDGDGCFGYLEEQIKSGGYSCESYTKSKVRLLTYNEYNYILKNITDHKWLYNSKLKDFWLMNGYSKNGYFAFKVNKFGQVYLDEKVTSLLEVRPVVTIYK